MLTAAQHAAIELLNINSETLMTTWLIIGTT